MNIGFIVALLVLVSGKNYTYINQISNSKNLTKVIFNDNFELAFFYGPNSTNADVYHPYNWLEIKDEAYTTFPFPPNTMQIYTDLQNRTSLLFAGVDGKIKKRSFVTGGAIDSSLWTITDEFKNVTRASPSPDSTMYLAYCDQGSTIYIGNLTSQNLIYVLDYSDKGEILSAKWRPGTSQLLVLGGNSSETNFIQLFDISTKTREDLSSIKEHPVRDFVFKPDGQTLYFCQSNEMEQTIFTYDMITQIVSDFDSYEGEPVLGLAIHNNFLTTYDEISTSVWDLVDFQYLGTYESLMRSSGLSSDGSTLITSASLSAIFILGICSPYQFYSALSNQCRDCKSPCLKCFFSATKCSQCIQGQYLLQNFTCGACIPNCKDCKDDKNCMVCQDGYFFDGQKCTVCSTELQGCELCMYSSICLQCNTTNHWVMKPNHKCQCMERYTKKNQTHCQDCPKNCLICSQPDFCLGCDPATNRQADQSGQCVCVPGFFEQVDICIQCSTILSNCLQCESQDNCTLCQEGYALNDQDRCEKIDDDGNNTIIIVVVVIIVVVLTIVGVFVWRFLKKRRNKKVPMLQTSLEDYQRADI